MITLFENYINRYLDILNEASMDDTYDGREENKSLLLFSDRVRHDFDEQGGKYALFYDFYEGREDYFTGLRLIEDKRRIKALKRNFKQYKFTLLTSGSYKDTDEPVGRRKLYYTPIEKQITVKDIINNANSYYFYDIVTGLRTDLAAPDRAHITREPLIFKDGRKWIFVITKGKQCGMVKSKSRQEGGKWAEAKLASLYGGWEESSHDIRMEIELNGDVIRANGLMNKIFHSDENDIFTVRDVPDTFVKYDLVVDDDKKLEVKKLKYGDERQLWDGGSVPFVLAEQCKIADRGTLEKIVEWYNVMYSHRTRSKEYKESLKLLDMDIRDMAYEFALREVPGKVKEFEHSDICDLIRDAYNSKLDKLKEAFNNLSKSNWMAGVYGIYFTGPNRNDRRYDFVIKTGNDISYYWDIVSEWLGFDRVKLFMTIDGNAWEYILTEGNNFVRAYKLKDYANYTTQRRNGLLNLPDGSVYRYDNLKSLWVNH